MLLLSLCSCREPILRAVCAARGGEVEWYFVETCQVTIDDVVVCDEGPFRGTPYAGFDLECVIHQND